jgi:iron complex outermembrane recepter protein
MESRRSCVRGGSDALPAKKPHKPAIVASKPGQDARPIQYVYAAAAAFCCVLCMLRAQAQPAPAEEQPATPPAEQAPVPAAPSQPAAPIAPSSATPLPTVTVQSSRPTPRRSAARPAKPPAQSAAAPRPAPPAPPATATPGGNEGTAANGYRATTVANVGPFAKAKLQDTPYSISVTPGALWENNNVHTTSDALKTNPAVVPLIESNGPSAGLSRVMIRGFTAADQDELRDGITDRSFTFPPIENVDHIEVLNGPSGFLYGFSEPGGTINYVSKQPTAQPLATLSTGVYGGALGYVHVDAGGPADPEGGVGYRINLYQEGGDTYIDKGTQQRLLLSGVLTYRIGDSSTLAFDYYHQDYRATGIRVDFAPYVSGGISHVPAAFDPTKQYGQPWTYNDAQKDLVGTKFVTDINDIFTFRTAVRYGYMFRDNTYIDALLTNNGSYTENVTQTTRQTEQTWAGYSLMDAKFDTGFIHHVVTFGYTDAYYYYTRGPNVTTALGASSVEAPAQFAPPSSTVPGLSNFQAQNLGNVLLGDRITFDRYWSALVGVNDAMIHQTGGGINGPSSTVLGTPDFESDKVTPTYSLLFTPRPWITLYGTYLQALEAGDQAPSTANGIPVVNASQILAPSVSTEYETGAKMQIGKFNLTTALFDINKVNAETNPVTNTYIQDGREDHKGIEVIGKGKLTDQLTVVGGFTLLDARIEQATALPASNGKIPINVPEQEARGYFEYAFPESLAPGLTLVGGANYYGKRPVDALNTGFIQPATIFDAGLRYEPVVYGHKLTFNLTVSNVFNTAYWASYNVGATASGMLPGAPRIVAFSAKVPLW